MSFNLPDSSPEIYYTDRGLETKESIHARAIKIPVKRKIVTLTQKLSTLFPQYTQNIRYIIGLYKFLNDTVIKDMLQYVPETLIISKMNEKSDNPIKYTINPSMLLIDSDFMANIFEKEPTNQKIYTFLSFMTHALTHAAQDARGACVTRIPKINMYDGIMYEMLMMIEAEMVSLRVLRQLVFSLSTHIPDELKNSFLPFYIACEKYATTNDIVAAENIIKATNMMLALEMMDFESQNPLFQNWRQSKYDQAVYNLMRRPIGQLTIDTEPDFISKTLEPYYGECFFALQEISESVNILSYEKLNKYIEMGEILIQAKRDVTNITYQQLYEMDECLKYQSDLDQLLVSDFSLYDFSETTYRPFVIWEHIIQSRTDRPN